MSRGPITASVAQAPSRLAVTALGGYVVALIRDDSAPEGPAFRVVIGPASSNVVESVAVMPAEPENETDAEAIGFAVVRALEIVEGNAAPESA